MEIVDQVLGKCAGKHGGGFEHQVPPMDARQYDGHDTLRVTAREPLPHPRGR
jgi:hypothetical protein